MDLKIITGALAEARDSLKKGSCEYEYIQKQIEAVAIINNEIEREELKRENAELMAKLKE